jgi:bifunctional DNA-binding transcriptional regulator/antitoxin component of YhaV-PrlF toxin-antitoxin module
MASKVKNSDDGSRRRTNQTKVSSKHQVTIPVGAFRGAGLAAGDLLRVEADGAGRIVLTRIDELLDRYSGCLDTGGSLREQVEGLRGEWR